MKVLNLESALGTSALSTECYEAPSAMKYGVL